MIQYEFKERTQKKLIPKKVSLIIATSPIPSHPNTDIVDKTLDSIFKMNYPFHEIIISYDKSIKTNKKYEKYKIKMKQKYPKFTHLPMKKHGHFIGSFHNALNHLETEYFMMLQHDIQLIGNFPIDKCLSYKFDWNIIATHHMKNSLKETHWFPIIQNKNKELQKVWGWSERIFLAKRNWMMDKIHDCYHDKRTKDLSLTQKGIDLEDKLSTIQINKIKKIISKSEESDINGFKRILYDMIDDNNKIKFNELNQ